VRARAPWVICALSAALVIASVVLWILGDESLTTLANNSYFNSTLIAITFPAVGALIVRKRPGNLVGWLFTGAGLAEGLSVATTAWGVYAIKTHPGLPGGVAAFWLDSMIFVPALSTLGFLLLLFPDGRLPAPRGRWPVRLLLTGVGLLELFFAFHPHDLEPVPGLRVFNPFGIDALEVPLGVAGGVGLVLAAAGVVGAVAALVSRFRRSRGRERQQLKWFTYAAVLMIGFSAIASSVSAGGLLYGILEALVIGPVLTGAVGIAMLRHRLYDIDLVVRRTLVYAALTAILAGVYLGTVLLLQLALDPLTSGSSLAVAVSTLAVAALFRPARARIQAIVDRRFYRRKYDAARTLEGFSSRLRDQVDLDALGGELRAVVAETMQPAHVSLWLRRAER
jgi:hypothetical protein